MVQHIQLDPDGRHFDEFYASMRGESPESIPWAHGKPHPMFAAWLEHAQPPASNRDRALIVGSGLGDDAEAVAARGWNVTAFDISEQAIAWTRERFPDSRVDYRVASVFEQPREWRQAFDLVVEIHTVQPFPVTRRQEIISLIADTLAPGGELVVVMMTRDVHVPFRGIPWPLTLEELATFTWYGLSEIDRTMQEPESPEQPGRARVSFTRPR